MLLLGQAAWAKPAVVIYPGSFDPFHEVHRQELTRVMEKLRAAHPEGVSAIVLPNHDAPVHIPGGHYVFSAAQREKLAALAVADLPAVRVHTPFSSELGTVSQLERVQAEQNVGQDVYLLLGYDAYRGLSAWEGHERILKEMNLVVSAPSEERARLQSPGELLGNSGRAFRPIGDGKFESELGRKILYLDIPVPPLRARTILMNLMGHRPVAGMIHPAVGRELEKRDYESALELSAKAISRSVKSEIEQTLGAKLSKRASQDGALSMALVSLDPQSTPQSLALLAKRIERQTRISVSPSRLENFARSEAHQTLFYPKDEARGAHAASR